jgi:hypothetical protein
MDIYVHAHLSDTLSSTSPTYSLYNSLIFYHSKETYAWHVSTGFLSNILYFAIAF